MHKKYLNKIDYFRGLAIIGIIAIHTIGCNTRGCDLVYFLNINLKQVMTYSVPFFVFISGLVLTYVHYDEKIDYIKFTKKRINAVLYPYLTWSCIYLAYRIAIENESISILAAIKKVIVGSAEFHLWYILLIFQLYLVFPIVLKSILKFKERHIQLLAVVFALNLLIIYVYYSYFDYLNERNIRKVFIFWIFYFMLGSIMGLNVDHYKEVISNISLKHILVMYYIGLIGAIASFYYDGMLTNQTDIFWLRPYILIYATLSIILAIKLMIEMSHSQEFRQVTGFVKKLGKYSFGIYLIHIMILDIMLLLFAEIDILWSNPLLGYLLFALDLIISLIIVMAISRSSLRRFVVGTPR